MITTNGSLIKLGIKPTFLNPPARLKSNRSDIAPMAFYFDIFATDFARIPVLSVPMRVDKVTNGEPTLLILPNITEVSHISQELGLIIDYNLFFITGLQNLVR